MEYGGNCEDFRTYGMRHTLTVAITALQDFAYKHQLQDSGLVPELFISNRRSRSKLGIKDLIAGK